ncbi:helix-turn-helix domain-containing protein [Marinobacter sp. M1N3S26]|uniref:helix-turn-helix domain-containing protein n=1 Tax=unclassified Marinobacter TaxID=83889 RepID=UPI00387B9121
MTLPVLLPLLSGNDAMSLGQALRQFRKHKGLTLAELAEKTGSYVGNLSRIERDMANPSLDLLYRIAQALECSMADIFLASCEGSGKDPSQAALNAVFGSLMQQDRELLLDFARLLQTRTQRAGARSPAEGHDRPQKGP